MTLFNAILMNQLTQYIQVCRQGLQIGFRNILDPEIVVANVLKIWLSCCGFSFPTLNWLIFRYKVTLYVLKCQAHFITFFSIFKYRIFVFPFLTYLRPILYRNNSSVSRIFLPGHVNRHSKETNIFNELKKFLTIFNSSVDYNFVVSHVFNFSASCDASLVIPECILHFTLRLLLSCSN